MVNTGNHRRCIKRTWLFGYKDTNVSEKTESVEAVGDKSTTEKSNADDSVLYSVSEGTAILNTILCIVGDIMASLAFIRE